MNIINDHQNIALQAMCHDHKITEIAIKKQVIRDFLHSQKNKDIAGIESSFNPANYSS